MIDSGGGGDDWYLWLLFSFLVFGLIVIFIVLIFDEPEVRARSRQHARRLSDWYIQRTRRQDQDEVIMLSDPSIQNSNPPLYQTVVPPTYQYQKPPTPAEPPPKYESWPTEHTETVEGAGEAAGVVEGYQNTPLAPTDQQPEYVRSGKVKMNRSSPLASQIRNLVGHKLVDNGHNIFIRKNMDKNQATERLTPDQPADSEDEEEEIVFELDAQPVQSH